MMEKAFRWALCLLLLAVLAGAGCSGGTDPSVTTVNGVKMVARANGRYFQVYNKGAWN